MTDSNRVVALLDSEVANRWVMLEMLKFCTQPRRYPDIQDFTSRILEKKVGIHTPDVLLNWLDERGGLERVQIEDEAMWRITPAGIQAVEYYGQGQPLQKLISNHPEFREIYLKILEMCKQPCKREELEKALAEEPTLQRSRLHPAFFINELEKHGGLEWVDRHWLTTPDGKGVIA